MKIHIRNAGITLHGKTILEEVNFDISDKEHIAIIGRNGSGKTTFLKALMDHSLFEPGIGEEKFLVETIGNFQIGYLKQTAFKDESITLLDEIKSIFHELISIEKRLDLLVSKLEENSNDKTISEYTDLLDKYQLMGGYTYKKEYEVMLKKFGFKESDKTKLLKDFSGGEKMRISFIKLLLSKPDLLILDEPTNHLDITTILWLEEYLQNYPKAIILVTHDRMFINKVANIIYDIEYGKTTRYVGNFEFFEKEKKLNYEHALNDYEYQQKEIKRLKAIYERFRFKPSKASLAISRLHQLEKMTIIEKPKQDIQTFKINFQKIIPTSETILRLKNVTIGYDLPLSSLNFEIKKGMKIGIIGANGTGKSTLLKTISEKIPLLSGKIIWGTNIKVGYFDQNLSMLDEKNTILDEFRESYPDISLEEARNVLGAFLFRGEDVFKEISVLSGGEKVRLQLCKIFYENPNFLIMDEPTNHLDISGKIYLENILKEYQGTIIFVSHDRYFVQKIATSLIVFEKNNATFHNYTYDKYLETLDKNNDTLEKVEKSPTKKSPKSDNIQAKKIKQLEKEITKEEEIIKKLNDQLFLEEIYTDYEKSLIIKEEIKKHQEILTAKEQEWEKIF